MKKITSIIELQESILFLEMKKTNEEILLKAQFNDVYKKLKPISLIKSTIGKLTNQSDFKENVLNTSLGLLVGYVSKKIIFGSTRNPFKQILGSLIQVGVTGIISKNADDMKCFATRLINNFTTKNDKSS